MTFTDITTFSGAFVDPDSGRRYTYDASFNAMPPVAWKADLSDGHGWATRLAGALIDEALVGPQLRSAIAAAIAGQIRETLISRAVGPDAAPSAPRVLHS